MNAHAATEILTTMYASLYGHDPDICTGLPAGGSDRRYFRLSAEGEDSVIGVISDNLRENECFVTLALMLRAEDIEVPEILAVSDDYSAYLQQDLGDTSLFSLLHTEEGDRLVEECMRRLPHFQKAECNWEDAVMDHPFSRRQILWDLNYFKYEYLKPSGLMFDENALEDDFETLADDLLATPAEMNGLMYRDCQSRNVMVCDGKPYWIDFQGARKGPAIYDAVSFLWQAKAQFSGEFRSRMLAIYIGEYERLSGVPADEIISYVPLFVFFRTLQVLGAYGFRGLVQHRAHFIESIPGALRNLADCIEPRFEERYPTLTEICRRLTLDSRFLDARKAEGLVVEVVSFSYKRGYPDNFSGNGGGFMFDCRAMHNPGRYPEYKRLTGLDTSVARFLEERGEVQGFLKSAWTLTDNAVDRYLQRGFTSLQIGFGCTGGQHRSVYCAEATARHIAEKFPTATVVIIHREQDIRKTIEPTI